MVQKPSRPRAPKPASAQTKRASPQKAPVPPAAANTPLVEWVSAAIGLLLTLGVVGIIAWQALRKDEAPPLLSAEQLWVRPTPAGFLVGIRVSNQGGRSAAQVTVEGEVSTPGGETETAEITFDHVPHGSTRDGGLLFHNDPKGAVTLQAKGFVAP